MIVSRYLLVGLAVAVVTSACGGDVEGPATAVDPSEIMASSGGSNPGGGGESDGTASGGGGASGGGTTNDAGVGGSESVADVCPGGVRLCVDGDWACDLGECPGQCDPSECAEAPPDVTRVLCQDQTLGGPYCARDDTGACSWQLRECPEVNECEDDLIACTADTATTRVPPDCNRFAHCQVFCEPGARYYVPGCASAGDPVLPEPGCYIPCQGDTACPDGSVCSEVVTDPCAFSTCLACSGKERVCISAD